MAGRNVGETVKLFDEGMGGNRLLAGKDMYVGRDKLEESSRRNRAPCPYCAGVLADRLRAQYTELGRVKRLMKRGDHPFVHDRLDLYPSEGRPLDGRIDHGGGRNGDAAVPHQNRLADL